ncbi:MULTISPECIES: hypothetical protein [Streptomyces]|uniref:hypothetical protein n=1 Tax=Streptomyces TaxID=1883 RepID=UPI000A5E6525|nr:hypothetical protein [Streptomyces griseolus]
MYSYEMHQLRAAELIRRADRRRLVREAVAARTAARTAGRDDPDRRVSEDRGRFTRAA